VQFAPSHGQHFSRSALAIRSVAVKCLSCLLKTINIIGTAGSNARGVSQITTDNWWSSRDPVARHTQNHSCMARHGHASVVSRLSQMMLQKCSKCNICLLIIDSAEVYHRTLYIFRKLSSS